MGPLETFSPSDSINEGSIYNVLSKNRDDYALQHNISTCIWNEHFLANTIKQMCFKQTLEVKKKMGSLSYLLHDFELNTKKKDGFFHNSFIAVRG